MSKIKFYNRLRFQLVIFMIFLVIIPMIALGLTLSDGLRNIFNQKYSTVALQSIRETGDKIDYMLKDIQDYSTTVLSNRSFLNALKNNALSEKEMNETLRSFLAAKNVIDGISLISNNRTFTIGTNKTDPLISIQQMMQNHINGKPIWLSTKKQNIKILSGTFSRYYFSVARNIIDFNTLENNGVLVLDVEEVLLEQAYENVDTIGGDVFIIDEVGNIVSHSDKDFIGKSVVEAPFYETMTSSSKESGEVYYNENGEERVAFYSLLQTNNWRIVNTVSTGVLFKEINDVQHYFLMGAGIYGILIIFFLLGLALQYTEPMLKILVDLKKVEEGDLSVRTSVEQNNEIRELSDGINNMIDETEALLNRLVREEKLKREVELEALHAQINPHFLYNTLNTIKWMAKIQGADSVSNAIVALVKLLRISISIGGDFITLGEELEYIKNYVYIQRLRFNETFLIDYEIDSHAESLLIPKLILQPIIENSIIYGVDSIDELSIHVSARIDESTSELIIRVEDNGPGISDQVLKEIFRDTKDSDKLSKAGLNNVNQRIKLFCGEAYGQEIISEEGKGTTVIVKLPVDQKEGGEHV